MRLLFLLLFISGSLFAQQENALPPGPTTISGKLLNAAGKAISGATLTIIYPDGKQEKSDTFHSSADGYFTAYVFRDNQKYIELEIRLNGLLCKTIRYDHPGFGVNLGHPLDPILCPIKN